MKKLLLAIVILSVAIFAQAQDYSPEARAKDRVERLGKDLDLSEEQKKQLSDLFVEQSQKNKVDGRKLGEMTKEDRKAYIESRKAQRAAFDEKVEAILTPEQVEKYQARKGKGKKGSKGKGGKNKADRSQRKADGLAEKLDLSAEQKEAVVAALKELQPREKKNKEAIKSMTKEEKIAAHEARKAAKTALDEKIKTIFTAEQYETYQQLNEEKKKQRADKQMNKSTNRGAMIQKRLNQLSESLSLSTAQKAEVGALLNAQESTKTNKVAKKDWTPANRAANKEKRQAAKDDFNAQMKQILTEEQYATFQTLQEGRREKGRKRGSLKRNK